jgi:glycosyltransferase involved in cell wall biosynthesis
LAHICFIAPSIYPVISNSGSNFIGGSEIQQILIAKSLVRKGYRVTIVTSNFGQKKHEIFHGIHVFRGSLNFLGGSKILLPLDIFRLFMLLHRINADIYIVRNPPILQIPIATYCKLFHHHFVRMIASDFECSLTKDRGLVSRLLLWSAKYVNFTIFQNGEKKKFVGKNFGFRGCVIRSISHEQSAQNDEPLKKDIDVLWVGAYNDNKRPELFIELVKDLSAYNFCLISKTAYSNNYILLREEARKIANLLSTGFVRYLESSKYFMRSKILVCTSRYEGFPNTFLQAWQMGIPVVSLTVDPDNVITDNALGFVSENLSQMKKDIERLLSNESLRREYGDRAKAYVEKEHSSEVVVQQLIGVFENLLE